MCSRKKGCLASCGECRGRLHAEWFVEVISLDAGCLCCRQQALSYYVPAFISLHFYLIDVSSSSADAVQIVLKPRCHTPRGSTHCRATTKDLCWHQLIVTLNEWQQVPAAPQAPRLTCRLLSAALQCHSVMSANKSTQTGSPACYFSALTFFTPLFNTVMQRVSLYLQPNDQLSP